MNLKEKEEKRKFNKSIVESFCCYFLIKFNKTYLLFARMEAKTEKKEVMNEQYLLVSELL